MCIRDRLRQDGLIKCHMDMTRHEQKDDVKNVINFFTSSKLVSFASNVQEKNLDPNDPVSEFSFTHVTLK